MKPKVTLVGAGPGDPELISLKGMKAIQAADVVLYDALVSVELLSYAPARARIVYVGKRRGRCEFVQQDLNQLIVDCALTYGHAVRLKGGDSFVFGRGYEEISFAQQFGIETAVIPGISSSIAVPALAGIPLTCRGVSESFWVLTGTTQNHSLSKDVAKAAQSSATLVILMGMQHLSQIVSELTGVGKAQTPVAIIQNGSMPEEKIGIGTVETIAGIVEKQQLTNPAIIIIGEVVRLHPSFENGRIEALAALGY
ncbi:uroporphyrinogen-III C-methyltransferase [Runella slithyformis]|uniref:uroporphyrinogen-III C-methyltransferase n=1 Tax=Runella slithyformis (strain ATCC 29530 / DSM 19594 / LMG 11500 / NCIMB 11436 / LSU 4) TaxID=761193 RepID=A0A7U4E5U7_RUNSL|nr:uroporphyrinogen-III C-methyltransferase [Runella slithyformis]AEI48843.1 uroporphyrin-III C-methyltransferase [Runella slithyformis DSM 19594]